MIAESSGLNTRGHTPNEEWLGQLLDVEEVSKYGSEVNTAAIVPESWGAKCEGMVRVGSRAEVGMRKAIEEDVTEVLAWKCRNADGHWWVSTAVEENGVGGRGVREAVDKMFAGADARVNWASSLAGGL